MSVTFQQLQQQLNSIPNITGNGVPVQQYATAEQQILTTELTSVPNSQLTSLTNQTSALTALQTALEKLQSSTQSLASSQTWQAVNVNSSNPSAFTVSGQAGAIVSSFGVTVTQLAQNQVSIAQGSMTATSGSFTINYGTNDASSMSVTVTNGESLTQIIAAVNSDTSTTGVEAFSIGNNQLAFSSTNPGLNNQFTITSSGSNYIPSLGVTITTTQNALDAEVLVGGTPVTSTSNTFTNLLPNVTLNAIGTGYGTLNVSQNTSGVLNAVQNWMSDYNNVVDLLKNDTAYVPATISTTGTVGPLIGDASANGLLSQLPSAVSSMYSGNSSLISSLSSIGIVLDPNNGHLEFQSSAGFTINGQNFGGSLQDGQTMFTNAIQNNLADVQSVFGVIPNTTISSVIPQSGVLGALNNTLNQFLGFGLEQGAIPSELSSLNTQTQNINTYLIQVNQEITTKVSNFTAQLNSLNASLQKSQAQMQLVNSLFSVTSSSNSSSGSSSSSSSSSSTGG